MKGFIACVTLALVAGCTQNVAGPVVAKSSPGGSQLLELYTSQGCSSCPPAERFVGNLTKHPELWKSLVPVVFHVDYWDRLGWKDPFASKANTKRQYDYSGFHRMRSVYTPGFFANGREWRGFFERRPLPSQRVTGPSLKATWDAGRVVVETAPQSAPQQLHVAVLGFGLKTSVKRGENSGRSLEGNFVVLAHEEQTVSSQQTKTQFKLSDQDLAGKAPRYGFAVWMTAADSPLPKVATGNWLPKKPFQVTAAN